MLCCVTKVVMCYMFACMPFLELQYLALLPGMLMSSSKQVMEELRLRRPGFQPTRMLDFGAGPGTATWAATQVQMAAVQCQTRATLPKPWVWAAAVPCSK